MRKKYHTCLLCDAQLLDCLAHARGMVLFVVAFRTGSRGSDLATLLAAEVLRLPSSQGLVLNFQFTKIIRDGAAHASLLAPDNGMPETYAVTAMIPYARTVDLCRWDISTGYILSYLRCEHREIALLTVWPDPFPQSHGSAFQGTLETRALGVAYFYISFI